MAVKKITAQHLVLVVLSIAALALINTYAGPHWLGWGAAPEVSGSKEILEAIGGVNTNVSKVDEKATAALNTAKEALNTSKLANATASSKTAQTLSTSGLVAGQPPVVVSATNTVDDQAYSKARTYLSKSTRIADDAERLKKDARDLDNDEGDDAADIKSDVNDLEDDRKEAKSDINDLQDTIYQEWANQPRNVTAQNLAGQTLDDALTELSNAKEDIKDALADANDILKPEDEESGQQTTPQVVYVQAPAGQVSTTPAVAGYESQTEGL